MTQFYYSLWWFFDYGECKNVGNFALGNQRRAPADADVHYFLVRARALGNQRRAPADADVHYFLVRASALGNLQKQIN